MHGRALLLGRITICFPKVLIDIQIEETLRKRMYLNLFLKTEDTSPGISKVNPEHMISAAFPELANILEDAYSIMISMTNIPDLFLYSLIVLIPKMANLNPNIPTDYRPVAIRSIHDKLVEYSFKTENTANENQFGFRKVCKTTFAISLLNDAVTYAKASSYPLYECIFDLQKIFQQSLVTGLGYKLINTMPHVL